MFCPWSWPLTNFVKDGKLETVRARGPVGGSTSIDFARDHGAVVSVRAAHCNRWRPAAHGCVRLRQLTIGKGGPVGGAQTYHFDPKVRKRTHARWAAA